MRTDVGSNVPYLLRTTGTSCPPEKIKLIYASMTMRPQSQAHTASGRLAFQDCWQSDALWKKKASTCCCGPAPCSRNRAWLSSCALVGSGPLETELKNLAANELRVTDVVSFPGFVAHDAVPGLLCDTDVFVMPSQVAQ